MSQSDEELVKVANELKHLEIEKRKKLKHKDNIIRSLSTVEDEIADIQGKINRIKARMKDPLVTEHAILRYIQRVEGRSLEDIIHTILPPEKAKQVKVLGSGVYPIGDFKIRVKDGIVVTVFKEDDDDRDF